MSNNNKINEFVNYLVTLTNSQLKEELKKTNLSQWQIDAIKQELKMNEELYKMEIEEVYFKKEKDAK